MSRHPSPDAALHPGQPGCDLTFDLTQWIISRREQAALHGRWSRVLRQRGTRLRDVHLCGLANDYGQQARWIRQRADQVAQAHQWRLPEGFPIAEPLPPRQRTVRPQPFWYDTRLRAIHQLTGAAYRAAHARWLSDWLAGLPRADEPPAELVP